MDPEISVVIPVFNESQNLAELYERLSKVLKGLGRGYELIFVDDGSTDESFEILKSFQSEDKQVRITRFTRNFGQHPAVSAGFKLSKGEIIVTLDADLQNPPEEIPKLIEKIDEGWYVAAGWRSERQDTLLRKIPSVITNKIIGRMTGTQLKDYGCMLRAYRRKVIEELEKCREVNKFITVLVSWLGFSVIEVKVRHEDRKKGRSKYGFGKLISMNLDMITGFSMFPIQAVSIIGFITAAIGLATSAFLIAWRLIYGAQHSLITAIAIIIFIGGVQLLSLGLIGEYIGRILVQSQDRPYYVIDEVL